MWGAISLTVILQLLIVYLPVFQNIFKTASLDIASITAILIVTIACVLCIELLKYLSRFKYSQ